MHRFEDPVFFLDVEIIDIEQVITGARGLYKGRTSREDLDKREDPPEATPPGP
jgi:hypothetical protein